MHYGYKNSEEMKIIFASFSFFFSTSFAFFKKEYFSIQKGLYQQIV